ncbi:hypothetical protein GCG54_00001226 [Colletotrichum gloeosporioides]|uniref:Tat pathway signal sequence n=1 Tax=Colletotrichum gloeosporioides TaxID=474922 RepID=A0A8H4FEA1_COLGL|nr:uncharacterized protein GCG54_00001226 [Colletotrichum gloeosporioides]KAF3799187.1 hypothetical protein GCG54_00001226 [Colletotrichum gloeosporioides]
MGHQEKGYTPVFSDERSASSLDNVEVELSQARSKQPSRWHRFRSWTLHTILITAYSTIFFLSMARSRQSHGHPQEPSVTRLILKSSPFKGLHTENTLENLGLKLIRLGKICCNVHNNIRVSDQWVHRWGREHEAVNLPDGGYLGMLSVFHELHCIKRLYQTLSPEYYFPNATDKEIAINKEHNQHCLEVLRMGAACRGDISIITHMWTDKDAQPIVNQTAPHQCVDFNKVMEYSRDNAVDVYQDNYIVHPKFGPSFPHGHSIKPFKEQEMGHHH